VEGYFRESLNQTSQGAGCFAEAAQNTFREEDCRGVAERAAQQKVVAAVLPREMALAAAPTPWAATYRQLTFVGVDLPIGKGPWTAITESLGLPIAFEGLQGLEPSVLVNSPADIGCRNAPSAKCHFQVRQTFRHPPQTGRYVGLISARSWAGRYSNDWQSKTQIAIFEELERPRIHLRSRGVLVERPDGRFVTRVNPNRFAFDRREFPVSISSNRRVALRF
jgi:hypothetical protein